MKCPEKVLSRENKEMKKENYKNLSKSNEASELVASENPEKKDRCKNLKYLLKCLLIVLFVYFCLYLIISHSNNNDEHSPNESSGESVSPIDTSCGADSFMLRDAVCDEATNNAICQYDGGDCCLEIKDTTLCKNCSCIMSVDPRKLLQEFMDLEIKPIEKAEKINATIESWTVTIDDVISIEVCAVVCLGHDKRDSLNAWHYKENEHVCNCGWIDSVPCPEHLVSLNWAPTTLTDLTIGTYIQMKKLVPCECMALDLLFEGTRTLKDRKEMATGVPSTMSVWHCQQKCVQDDDCLMFSWAKSTENNTSLGECRRFEGLESNHTISDLVSFVPGWISSVKECNMFNDYFNTFTTNNNAIQFACPLQLRGQVLASEMSSSLIANEDFLIILSDFGLDNQIKVFKIVDDMFLQCAHSLTLPKSLQDATGGVLVHQGTFHIVVCSGKDKVSNDDNDLCYSLSDPHKQLSGQMKPSRIGAASLVIDDGKTLWVTGGHNSDRPSPGTNYVQVSSSTEFRSRDGRNLPVMKWNHCLGKVGKNIAILIGGKGLAVPVEHMTWSVNVSTMDWRQQMPLTTGRSKHACGVLKDLSVTDKIIVIAAGGETSDGTLTDSVELMFSDGEDYLHSVPHSNWEIGPNIPVAVSDPTSIVTADQRKLFLLGVATNALLGQSLIAVVYKLHCSDLQCQWTKLDHEMNLMSRSKVLAFLSSSIPLALRANLLSSCDLFNRTRANNILMLSTGVSSRVNFKSATSDAFTIDNKDARLEICELPPVYFPESLSYGTGGLLALDSDDMSAVICGGIDTDSLPIDKCFRLGYDQPVASLRTGRAGPASVVLRNGTVLWVTGGYSLDYGDLDTSDWIEVSPGSTTLKTTEGVKLPRPMSRHCLEKIDENFSILYGGYEMSHDHPQIDSSWIFNLDNTSWIQEASMTTARSAHICGVLRDMTDPGTKHVIAAGGKTWPDIVTDNVELLRINHKMIGSHWQQGQTLPVGLYRAASTTSINQTVLYVAGGITLNQAASYAILTLRCSGLVCEWRTQCFALQSPRISSVAFIFPPLSGLVSLEALSSTNTMQCEENAPLNTDWVCAPYVIADNQCDGMNNNPTCLYDGGDCCSGDMKDCNYCSGELCLCHETGSHHCDDTGTCPWGGDGDCDGENNVVACNFDAGDCCMPLSDCKYCEGNGCVCDVTGSSHCAAVPAEDECNPTYIGDNICHGYNNNEMCGYDGGDCCSGHDENCWECSGMACNCHASGSSFCAGTCTFGGDGDCDGENNNPACNYDDGDCCLEKASCVYCEGNECICHETEYSHCRNIGLCPENLDHTWIADGYCDDDTNILECDFDGGDCCESEPNMDYCDLCECLE